MCVIIINQHQKQISDEILLSSSIKNPHGLGIVWLDTYHISYHQSTAWELLKTKRPYIAHFRLATIGKVNLDNMHPFKCGSSDEWLMQNGTIYGLGNQNVCDTKVLAKKLGKMPRQHWKHELSKHNCRFVSINTETKSFQIYNKSDWVRHNGVWYSKENILKHHMIAVYGTLKYGYHNYYSFLTKAIHVGEGLTLDKYPLVVKGLPYMVEKKGVGHRVEVDVFLIDDEELRRIDNLEGHPNWYKRSQIDVETLSDGVVSAWIYFNPETNIEGVELQSSYRQERNLWEHTSKGKKYAKKKKVNTGSWIEYINDKYGAEDFDPYY